MFKSFQSYNPFIRVSRIRKSAMVFLYFKLSGFFIYDSIIIEIVYIDCDYI